MATRRKKLLLTATLLALVALACVLFVPARFTVPQTFKLLEVRAHVAEGMPPRAINGDRQVEAEFEYTGPPVTPPGVGMFRRVAIRAGLASPPPAPRWISDDVVLLDAEGREMCRLASHGSSAPATRPAARLGLRGDTPRDRVVILWNFDLPANVDRSNPVTFRTKFGLNDILPVPIEVQLPASGLSTLPTASPVSSP